MATITAFARALSLIPRTRTAVMARTISTAGRLMNDLVVANRPVAGSYDKGADRTVSGSSYPLVTILRTSWAYPDHPLATVAAPTAYSRMRSQPMIQAKISPSVVYV